MVAKKEKEKEIKVRESYEVTRLSEDYLSGVYDILLPILTKDISKISKNNICVKNEEIKKTGSN